MIFSATDLGSIAHVFNGKTPSKSDQRSRGFPVLKIKDVDDFGQFRGEFDSFVDKNFAESFSEKIVRENDILLLNAAHNAEYVASKSFFAKGSAVGALATGEWTIVRANPVQVDSKFLSFWLDAPSTKIKIANLVRGIHLYPTDLAELSIPLPPLKVQREIGHCLETADRLCQMRRYALQMCDELLPAIFLQMFGDPRAEKTQWPTQELGVLGSLDRGRSKHRPRNAPHLYGGPHPFIQTGDVAQARRRILSHQQTYSEAGLKQSKLWPAGTLCITIAANIADTAVLTYPACFPDSIVGFIPGDHVTTEYVQFLLRFLQSTIERSAPEVAQKNINLEILSQLRCPIPPIALQKTFGILVNRHDQFRDVHVEALRQADHLFQTLLQQAFSSTEIVTTESKVPALAAK